MSVILVAVGLFRALEHPSETLSGKRSGAKGGKKPGKHQSPSSAKRMRLEPSQNHKRHRTTDCIETHARELVAVEAQRSSLRQFMSLLTVSPEFPIYRETFSMLQNQLESIFTTTKCCLKQKSMQIAVGGCFIGAVALYTTNPNPESYSIYAAQHLPITLKHECTTFKDSTELGPLAISNSDMCKTIINTADFVLRPIIRAEINRMTQQHNYGIFSIYETTLFGWKMRSLGVGQQFILLPS